MTEPEAEITEQDFHLRVVASLARLEIVAKSTEDHLDRLNVTVGHHEERLLAIQTRCAQQQLQCPIRVDVEALKVAVLSERVFGEIQAMIAICANCSCSRGRRAGLLAAL